MKQAPVWGLFILGWWRQGRGCPTSGGAGSPGGGKSQTQPGYGAAKVGLPRPECFVLVINSPESFLQFSCWGMSNIPCRACPESACDAARCSGTCRAGACVFAMSSTHSFNGPNPGANFHPCLPPAEPGGRKNRHSNSSLTPHSVQGIKHVAPFRSTQRRKRIQ